MVVAAVGTTLRLWDSDGKEAGVVEVEGAVSALSGDDGGGVLVGVRSGAVRVWEAGRLREEADDGFGYDAGDVTGSGRDVHSMGHRGPVVSLVGLERGGWLSGGGFPDFLVSGRPPSLPPPPLRFLLRT